MISKHSNLNHRFALLPVKNTKARIGLLGGSFNPPHSGHFHITLEAIKRLRLDMIIWLITPQNPMKKLIPDDLQARMLQSKAIANVYKVIVSDTEKYQKTYTTYTTIKRLKTMHSSARLVWVMGADNVGSFHKWSRWQSILNEVPLCVFDRVLYGCSIMYNLCKSVLVSYAKLIHVKYGAFKYWGPCSGKVFLFHGKRVATSSTNIRIHKEKKV